MKREWILKCILGFFALFCIGTIVKYNTEKVLAASSYLQRAVEIQPGVTVIPGVTIVPEMITELSDDLQETETDSENENTEAVRNMKEEDETDFIEPAHKDTEEMENTESEIEETAEAKEPETDKTEEDNGGQEESIESRPDKPEDKDTEKPDLSEEQENGERDEEEIEETEEETENSGEADTEGNKNDEENHPEEKRPDLSVVLKAETEESKAGRDLSYEIILNNTGEKDLADITMLSIFSREDVRAIWQKDEKITVDDQTEEAILKELKAGETAHVFLSAFIPEDMTIPLENSLTVTAKDPETDKWLVRRDAEICTTILPLSIDYEVEKIADRGVAYPGNIVTYTIMIRNTGERTLHSVVSAEHFLNEGIQAKFLYKEGILLNADCSQAYISKLAPGENAILKATVTIPEGTVGKNLINQVYVYTEETGKAFIQSEASVEVKAPEPTPTNTPEMTETAPPVSTPSTYAASIVQTGDDTPVSRWIRIGGASLLLVFLLYLAKHCRTDKD